MAINLIVKCINYDGEMVYIMLPTEEQKVGASRADKVAPFGIQYADGSEADRNYYASYYVAFDIANEMAEQRRCYLKIVNAFDVEVDCVGEDYLPEDEE